MTDDKELDKLLDIAKSELRNTAFAYTKNIMREGLNKDSKYIEELEQAAILYVNAYDAVKGNHQKVNVIIEQPNSIKSFTGTIKVDVK